MAVFNWDDHPVEQTPTATASPVSSNFNWDSHPEEAADDDWNKLSLGQKTMKVVGKALNYIPDVVTGPASGVVTSLIAGKPTYTPEDVANAWNPLTTKTFPSVSEQLAKGGLNNPSLYKAQDKNDEWDDANKYDVLKKLGPQNVGDAAQFYKNPLNMMGMGPENESLTASQLALQPGDPIEKILNMKAPPSELRPTVPQLGGATADTITKTAGTPISSLLTGWGKGLYNSAIQPVINYGDKFGKSDVPEALYQSGIATPWGLTDKAQGIVGKLQNAVNKLAGKSTSVANIEDVLAPAQEYASKMRQVGTPQAQAQADAAEGLIDWYRQKAAGKPGVPATEAVPATTQTVMTKDAVGAPVSQEVPVPAVPATAGTPAVEPFPYNAKNLQAAKQSNYGELPTSVHNELLRTPEGKKIIQSIARGQKEGVENLVAQDLGPQAGQAVTDLNDTSGKLLSTRQGQAMVERQAGRDVSRLMNPMSPVNNIVTALSPNPGQSLLAKMVLDAVNAGRMPIGYGMRALGESGAGPLLDMGAREKLLNMNKQQGAK